MRVFNGYILRFSHARECRAATFGVDYLNTHFFSKVPVDTDFQEIVKEISIMQQCDSPYVVKYYGSYFKNTDLWVRQSAYSY